MKPNELKTPQFRMMWPHLFEAHSFKDTDAPAYKVRALFSPADTPNFAAEMAKFEAELKRVHDHVAKEKWGEKRPKEFKHFPLLKSQEKLEKENEKGETYYSPENDPKGFYAELSAKFKRNFKTGKFDAIEPPVVVDRGRNRIKPENQSEIYSGCYAIAALRAYPWEFKNDKGKVMSAGVSFELIAVQKVADGEKITGRASTKPEELFEAFESSDTDTSSMFDNE
jgi:hypothetical protein